MMIQEVKLIVDNKTNYINWSECNDIKAELELNLIFLLGENCYPPVDSEEVYREIFAQV